MPQPRKQQRYVSNDARQARIGKIYEVCRDGRDAGTSHGSVTFVIDDEVPELLDLLHADLYRLYEARGHDDRAPTCTLYSLPFGHIHLLDRIEYPITIGHLFMISMGRVAEAG